MVKTQQEYDISIFMSIPRSPSNVERRNFMVTLYLLGSETTQHLETDARVFANAHENFGAHQVVFHSRRPSLVPYVDPMVSVAKRLILLVYYLLVPNSQACEVTVAMADRLAFSKSSSLPASAYVEIEAGQGIQIYSTTLIMTAQLRGLRWLMFHYRFPVYVAFTIVFWACEVMFMGLAWGVWVTAAGFKDPKGSRVRKVDPASEEYQIDDERSRDTSSDRPHSFPTYGRQPPLKHEPEVKAEYNERRSRPLAEIPVAEAEADDEDELYGGDSGGNRRKSDSGLGTSYSERGSESMRRRPFRT